MLIRDFVKRILLGSAIPQEYVCLAREDIQDPLRVTLSTNKGFFDVSASHLFLGYKPLVIGITVPQNSIDSDVLYDAAEVCLSFHTADFTIDKRWRDFPTTNDSVARLILKKKDVRVFNDTIFFLYEGVYGKHQLINEVYQFVAREKEKRRKDKATNINLLNNLGDQVQIAYAIPRIISIITLTTGTHMNMFPTDLHGEINSDHYVGSLRHGGKASRQVEDLKQIVISEVDVTWHREAYGLGKNHMQDVKPYMAFSYHAYHSKMLDIPVPTAVTRYREMHMIEFIDLGIHRIYFYRIVGKEILKTSCTLAHVHRFYSQWCLNNNVLTNVHLR